MATMLWLTTISAEPNSIHGTQRFITASSARVDEAKKIVPAREAHL
jgi:hypothetical protein